MFCCDRSMGNKARADWLEQCKLIPDFDNICINGHRVGFYFSTCFGKFDPSALVLFGGSPAFACLIEHHRDEFVGRNAFHFASKEVLEFRSWQATLESITKEASKEDSVNLGCGALVANTRFSGDGKAFAFTVTSFFVDGKSCCLGVSVEMSKVEANDSRTVAVYTEALRQISLRAPMCSRFMLFVQMQWEDFITRELVGFCGGLIAPLALRPQVRKTFIEFRPVEREEKRLRDTVSCPGDFQSIPKTRNEIDMELCSKFSIGARVRMIGFKNGTWHNGTEGIVTAVPVPGQRGRRRVTVSSSNPTAPRTVNPRNLILLEEEKTGLTVVLPFINPSMLALFSPTLPGYPDLLSSYYRRSL